MVKPLKFSLLKLLSALTILTIIAIFVHYLVFYVCNRDNLPWQMDWDYSYYLTVKEGEYEFMTGVKSADTVDALRVYKVTRKHYEWYGLEELLEKEVVFETKEKPFIRKFILSAQKWMDVDDSSVPVEDRFPASERCRKAWSKEEESDKYYVVMFDNTFMRAGYFLLFVCENQDKEYLEILVPDTSGFGPIAYYNDSLFPIFSNLPRIKNYTPLW